MTCQEGIRVLHNYRGINRTADRKEVVSTGKGRWSWLYFQTLPKKVYQFCALASIFETLNWFGKCFKQLGQASLSPQALTAESLSRKYFGLVLTAGFSSQYMEYMECVQAATSDWSFGDQSWILHCQIITFLKAASVRGYLETMYIIGFEFSLSHTKYLIF